MKAKIYFQAMAMSLSDRGYTLPDAMVVAGIPKDRNLWYNREFIKTFVGYTWRKIANEQGKQMKK